MQPNHLFKESSPYLQQHAYNPIDWYPWGQEALEKAKTEEKPIFLSIGYSTCHWCHVMGRETFEDQEIANLLNDHYVAIKVDREERPDIDSAYMTACQVMTGQGGWPMSILTTEDGKPFFAATYLPPRETEDMTGLKEVLEYYNTVWQQDKASLLEASDEIQKVLRQTQLSRVPKKPNENLRHAGFLQLKQRFDPQNGGFGSAPKFPLPHSILFLLDYAKREQNQEALDMAEKTLEQMYRGGIFDHIGGGFSRYTVDACWLTPHFEKMLYDNALLALAYTEAYALTKKDLYRAAAQKTLDYVLRELSDTEGGFYCGQDADSDGEEGKYYTWTVDELEKLMGDADSRHFCDWFHMTKNGNFEGKNIPNLLENPQFAQSDDKITELSQKAYVYRKQRTKLHRDEKILVSWNGLMIAALAKAYANFQEVSYLSAAVKGSQWIFDHFEEKGRFLDDYAFFTYGLLTLYQVTKEESYLQKAESIAATMLNLFFDREKGGFYLSSKDDDPLFFRPRELYDGALPSGNAVAAYDLMLLGELTEKPSWQHAFKLQQDYLAGNIEHAPANYCFSLLTF